MADSMMMAGTGPSLNVSGSRIAIAPAGPSPGSTPTSVPITQPMKANSRFAGVSAAARPASQKSKTAPMSEAQCAGGQQHLEQGVEDEIHQQRASGCSGKRHGNAHAVQAQQAG